MSKKHTFRKLSAASVLLDAQVCHRRVLQTLLGGAAVGAWVSSETGNFMLAFVPVNVTFFVFVVSFSRLTSPFICKHL